MSNADIVIKYREFMKERKEKMMDAEKIVSRYRMAKESDRAQRLRELADANHCNVQEIKNILLANGVSEDELTGKKKAIVEKKEILPYFAFEQNMNDMINTLNEQANNLQSEIDRLQEEINKKNKMLEATTNAYAALIELNALRLGSNNE